MAGVAFNEYGALSGKVEAAYGTDPIPTEGLKIVGQPTYTHDDTFEQPEFLQLENTSEAAPRQHNKLDLSFQCAVGYMEDIDDGLAANHEVYMACGFGIHDQAGVGAAGSGNYIEYRPLSAGYNSATFYGYLKEDAASELTILKHRGSRGGFNLQVEGGNPILQDVTLSALHGFWEPFADDLTNVPPTRIGRGVGYHESDCVTATIDGNVVEIVAFSYNPGYEAVVPENEITACDAGVTEIDLNDGDHTGQLTLKFNKSLIDGTDTEDWLKQAHDNDVDFAFVLTRDDGVQIFQITMPKMRFQSFDIQDGNNDRKVVVIDYVAQADAGNDQCTIRHEVK
jgi:hypothetical protein